MADEQKMSASEKKKEDWMNSKWRPMMGWMYMIVCFMDMVIFPILWSLLQTVQHQQLSQWNPLTLQGAGLFHIAMGAVLGIAAFGRTQEKLAGTAANAPAPATPTGVGLTGSGSVSWTAVSGATSYEIQFYTAQNGSGLNAAGPYTVTGISSSPYQLTSPYGGTNANWARVQVRARNSAGASSYSAWVPSATTYT